MTDTRVKKLTSIIAEEIGCPSWIKGENPLFSYCCDRSPEGITRPCFCEKAALLSLATITEPLLQP